MSILHHWQEQRDTLRNAINGQAVAADVIYQVRHALLQTEQNALADMGDDLLRQQAGVLMSCLKGSLGFLEAHTAGEVWVAQKSQLSKQNDNSLWQFAAVALAVLALFCSLDGQWLAAALAAAGLGLGFFALMKERKAASAILPKDEVRASVSVDIDRMFAVLESQLRAIDRYLDDFSYLNAQARGDADCADPAVLSRAVEMVEALYDCSEAERAPVEEAARLLLRQLGLETVEYSEETSRLFNALPSKSVTRTLSPALLSVKDQKLLRRGTAAVRIDAA